MALNWKGMTEEIIVSSGINVLTGLAFGALFAIPTLAYGFYTKWQLDKACEEATKKDSEIFEAEHVEVIEQEAVEA